MAEDLLDDFRDTKSSVRPYSIWMIVLLVLNPLVLFIGNALAFGEIESIMVSGAILGASSLLLLIGGLLKRRLFPILGGSFGLLSVLLVFLVINIFELSPSEAEKPIPFLICCFSGATLLLYGLFIFRRNDKIR